MIWLACGGKVGGIKMTRRSNPEDSKSVIQGQKIRTGGVNKLISSYVKTESCQ